MMTTMMKMSSLKTMTITKEHLDSLPLQEEAPAEGARELKIICKRRTIMIFKTSVISLPIHTLPIIHDGDFIPSTATQSFQKTKGLGMRFNTEDGKLGGVIEETITLVKRESISRCMDISTKKKQKRKFDIMLENVIQTFNIAQLTNKLEEMQVIESTHFLTAGITAS